MTATRTAWLIESDSGWWDGKFYATSKRLATPYPSHEAAAGALRPLRNSDNLLDSSDRVNPRVIPETWT